MQYWIDSKLAYTQLYINKASSRSKVSFVAIGILIVWLAFFFWSRNDSNKWLTRLYTTCVFPRIRFIIARHFHELFLNKVLVFLVFSIFLSPTVSLAFIAIIAFLPLKLHRSWHEWAGWWKAVSLIISPA